MHIYIAISGIKELLVIILVFNFSEAEEIAAAAAAATAAINDVRSRSWFVWNFWKFKISVFQPRPLPSPLCSVYDVYEW